MVFSYNKLWKILIDKGMMKKDLMQQANLTSTTIAKMGKPPRLGALTHFEQIKLLDHTDAFLKDVVTLLLLTGLRQGELLALQGKNIEFKNGFFNICETWDKSTNAPTAPKTKASYRDVPFLDTVKNILLKYYRHDYMFRPLITNVLLSHKLSAEIKAIGTDYSGHILRHTFITNAYELNIPPFYVQSWVGHYKVDQARTYLGLRKPNEFLETEVVKYMRELKNKFCRE